LEETTYVPSIRWLLEFTCHLNKWKRHCVECQRRIWWSFCLLFTNIWQRIIQKMNVGNNLSSFWAVLQ